MKPIEEMDKTMWKKYMDHAKACNGVLMPGIDFPSEDEVIKELRSLFFHERVKEDHLFRIAVASRFPWLFKNYPRISWWEKFVVRHIIHLNREVYRDTPEAWSSSINNDSVEISYNETVCLSYRLPFKDKEYLIGGEYIKNKQKK